MTPRSAKTSRAASRMRWRVASRRGDRCASPAAGSALDRGGAGTGIRLGDRRSGPVPGRRRVARHRLRGRGHRAVRGRGPVRMCGRGTAVSRSPSMPPSRPAAALAPSVSRPCVFRYTCVSDTLTYRIRARILAVAVKRRNPLPHFDTGSARRARPGEAPDVRAPGLLDLPVPIPDPRRLDRGRGLHGRGRAQPVRRRVPRTRPPSCPRTRRPAPPRTPSSAPSPGAPPRRRRPSRWTARAG